MTQTALGSARAAITSNARGICPYSRPRALLGALAFACASAGPIAVRAQDGPVPSMDRPSRAALVPSPTVLRGTPLSTTRSVPICPPGYALSGYACIEPSGGSPTAGGPGYDYWSYYGYWPEHGYENRYGGFAGGGSGADRFAGSRNARGFYGSGTGIGPTGDVGPSSSR